MGGKEQKASGTAPTHAPTHVLEALENLPTPPLMRIPRSPLDSRRLSDVLSEGSHSGAKDHDSFASAMNETVNETQDLSFVSAANDSASFLSMASPDQQKAAATALAKAMSLKKAADEAKAEACRKQEAAEERAKAALALAEEKQAQVEALVAKVAAMERELAERKNATPIKVQKAAPVAPFSPSVPASNSARFERDAWALAAATGAGAAALVLGIFLYSKSLSAAAGNGRAPRRQWRS